MYVSLVANIQQPRWTLAALECDVSVIRIFTSFSLGTKLTLYQCTMSLDHPISW